MSEQTSEPRTRRSQRAGADQAVAAEAPVQASSVDPSPAPTEAAPEVEVRSCCDENKTVYQTDGVAAEPIKYCKQHLPANVSREMVQRYQAGQ